MKALDHRLIVVGLLALGISGCTLAGANAAPLTPVVSNIGEVVPSETVVEQPQQLPTPTTASPIEVFETQTAVAVEAAQVPTEVTPTEEPGGAILPEETAEPTEEPTEEPTQEPAETQAPAETQEPAASCPSTHTVQAGENLYRIALRYGLTYQELASANGITNPDSVAVGTVLTIPGCAGAGSGQSDNSGSTGSGGETLHTVQAGENLFRISLQYDVSVQELAQYNGITNADSISVGQVIRIPPRN
ncbi:MAG: LysM peptidoglycan-binding domain-containing protein [Chloroflexota bacterium]